MTMIIHELNDCCGVCHYFNFLGLDRHCFHPDHPKPIKKWGLKCPEFLLVDQKMEKVEVRRLRVADMRQLMGI